MGQGQSQERVMRVADLVEYQEETVASRVVAKNANGSVTVFAFDRSQGLSEHTVPYDAVVHALDGEAELTISGRKYRLRQGEMIVMPAGQPHSLTAITRFKMLLAMMRV